VLPFEGRRSVEHVYAVRGPCQLDVRSMLVTGTGWLRGIKESRRRWTVFQCMRLASVPLSWSVETLMSCSVCTICASTVMASFCVGAKEDFIDSKLVCTGETGILARGACTVDIAVKPFKNPLPLQVVPCCCLRATASELQATHC
jgi:hypothetical protein